MTRSWIKALDAYSDPVGLRKYKNARQFPGFFEIDIPGDRESTQVIRLHPKITGAKN